MNTMVLFLQVTLLPRKQLRESVSISTGEGRRVKCTRSVSPVLPVRQLEGKGTEGDPLW